MKRNRLLPVLLAVCFSLLLVSSFLFTPGSARAASSMPRTSCAVCNGSFVWSGGALPNGTRGAQSQFTIDNPNGSGFVYYQKTIQVRNSAGSYLDVGIDNNDVCAVGLHFYYDAYDAVTGHYYGPSCPGLDAFNDPNFPATFALSYYLSNGGGAFFYIYGTHAGDDPCPVAAPCSVGDSNLEGPWTTISYDITIDSTVTTHKVWGGHWQFNQQYYNGAWHNLSATQDGSQYSPNPVTMYWHTFPTGYSSGDMWSCVYPAGTSTCSIGS